MNSQQLQAARAELWHQHGQPLLTLDDLRTWLDQTGLCLYTPRHTQMPTPAPSLIEAVSGHTIESPSAAAIEPANALLVRLVSEGAAIPLNLLGTLGEQPDFIASTATFPYIYTLRGDRNWKQPPTTSGAGKVSPLAAHTWQMLHDKGAMTVAELLPELGREVTEAAVLRALGELWSLLRVIPAPQQDGKPAIWELTTQRFTKQIKSGANAGQPTALSALISLYLSSAIAATAEEIEIFLSPLTARSRVREVLSGLTAARQLESTVLEGKAQLHIAGSLPEFPEIAEPEEAEVALGAEGDEIESRPSAIKTFTPRIPRQPIRTEPRDERERRPFQRSAGPRSGEGRPERPSYTKRPAAGGAGSYGDRSKPAYGKPRYDKPWQERENRPSGERADRGAGGGPFRGPARGPVRRPAAAGEAPRWKKPEGEWKRPEGGFKERQGGFKERPSFGPRGGSGDRPSFKDRKPAGRPAGDRPSFGRAAGGERPSSGRPFRERQGGDRPAGNRPYGDRPKPSFGDRPRFEKPAGTGFRKFEKPSGDRPARPFAKRTEDRSQGRPTDRKGNYYGGSDSKPRPRGDEKPFSRTGEKPFARPGGRPAGTFSDRPRSEGKPNFGEKPKFGGKPSFDRKPGSKPPARFGGKSSGGFGSKPGFKSAGKPGGKFAGNSGGASRGTSRGPASGKSASKPRTRTTTSSGKPRRKEGESEA
ncbi:MAG: hypothetical protein ACYC46_09960 [Acidobacteriaceae bacterium]